MKWPDAVLMTRRAVQPEFPTGGDSDWCRLEATLAAPERCNRRVSAHQSRSTKIPCIPFDHLELCSSVTSGLREMVQPV